MSDEFQPGDPARFEAALRRFDEENAGPATVEPVAAPSTPASCSTRNG